MSYCMSHKHMTNAGFTICVDAPTIEDSCYARALQAAGLSWSPPRSCGAVNEYEVLYTQSTCNASDSTLPHGAQNNETNVILTSSETYCIRVRAVINGTFYSNFSTCAEVASLEEGKCVVVDYMISFRLVHTTQ